MANGWGEERRSYGGFVLTDDQVRANTRPSMWSQISPSAKRTMAKVGAAVLGIAGLAYLIVSTHQDDRIMYEENLKAAQEIYMAADSSENRAIEDNVWSYIARVEREGDLHAVSSEELHTLKHLLSTNKVQGTPSASR